ncbi:MAG: TolC family protein [Muribaculaceae bacterium]
MKRYVLAVAATASVASMTAQDVLTMEQCRTLALQHNKEVAAAKMQTASARYMRKSYKALYLPDFSASGNALYHTGDGVLSIPGGNLPTFVPGADGVPQFDGRYALFPGMDFDYKIGLVYSAGVQVKQPIYQGGKIIAANRIAALSEQMSIENERLTASDVVLNTENAYVLLVRATEMRKVAEKYNALLAELLRNVESAYRHGLKPQNDVLKVQVKLNESELQLRKAENAIRLARMNLCHCIGRPLTDDITVADSLPGLLAAVNREETLNITQRPEYAILEHKVAIAEQQVKLNRSELLPKVGVQAGYAYTHGVKVRDNYLFDNGGFSVLLNVQVPLFHFGERSNKVRSARAALQQSQLERDNLNEKMMLELAQAINNLDEARMECDIADRSLAQADENRRLSNSQYRVGLETLSDNLEAQTLWQQAYETQITSRYQLYLTYLAYQKATGNL